MRTSMAARQLIPRSDFVTAYLARYVVIGVCILGLLSGLGAMQAVWDYILEPFLLARSKTWKSITDADITSTELAVARVRKDIAEREAQLDRRQALAGDAAPTQGSWVSRVFGSGDKGSAYSVTGLELCLKILQRRQCSALNWARCGCWKARWPHRWHVCGHDTPRLPLAGRLAVLSLEWPGSFSACIARHVS